MNGERGEGRKNQVTIKMPHGVRSHSDYSIFKHKRFVDGLWGGGFISVGRYVYGGHRVQPPHPHPHPTHPTHNIVRLCKVRESMGERVWHAAGEGQIVSREGRKRDRERERGSDSKQKERGARWREGEGVAFLQREGERVR
jgi:hypothetical protein